MMKPCTTPISNEQKTEMFLLRSVDSKNDTFLRHKVLQFQTRVDYKTIQVVSLIKFAILHDLFLCFL